MIRRRHVALGAGSLLSMPALAQAPQRISAARTVRAVLFRDLPAHDPIANTSLITYSHGALSYDMLMGMD